MKYVSHQVSGIRESLLSERKKNFAVYFLPLLLFILSSFLLYLPVLNRFFVSDDFLVLDRVCRQHQFLTPGFFRPLSDFSIFLNYRMAGLHPAVYNAFNILVHGFNSYLVYLICLFFGEDLDPSPKKRFAVFSSVVFLTYPFHNEAVVWLLGRGASLACLFGLLAIVSYYRLARISHQSIWVCLFYFISLSAFESTILFPLIFLVLLLFERKNTRTLWRWTVLLSATLMLHLFIRYIMAGTLLGNYGEYFFHSGIKIYVLNLAKTLGRLILPPSPHSTLITGIFLGLLTVFLWILIRNRRSIRQSPAWRPLRFLLFMLLISCLIPVVTGISTQTSETDRTLYLPSVFLSMMMGWTLVFAFQKTSNQWILLLLILVYQVFFLELNNTHWIRASRITESILTLSRKISTQEPGGGKVYFLNIPKEIEGAYVFRLGFADALEIYDLDRKRFIAVNFLSRQILSSTREQISWDPQQEIILLPAAILLKADSSGCRNIYEQGVFKFSLQAGDHLFFWNQDQLEEIPPCLIPKPHI